MAPGSAHHRPNQRKKDVAWPELARAFAAAVAGDTPATRRALRAAIRGGAFAARAREAMRMVHLFAGFPRNLTALEALDDVVGGAAPRAPRDRIRPAAGRAVFERIYAEKSDAVLNYLSRLDPVVAAWIGEHAYGRVLSRPGLSPRERELFAVAALIATRQEKQLLSHVLGALRCGADRADVRTAAAQGFVFLSGAPRRRMRAALRAALERAFATRQSE
jgi:4-carboxymuconolactone decarboxylase